MSHRLYARLDPYLVHRKDSPNVCSQLSTSIYGNESSLPGEQNDRTLSFRQLQA